MTTTLITGSSNNGKTSVVTDAGTIASGATGDIVTCDGNGNIQDSGVLLPVPKTTPFFPDWNVYTYFPSPASGGIFLFPFVVPYDQTVANLAVAAKVSYSGNPLYLDMGIYDTLGNLLANWGGVSFASGTGTVQTLNNPVAQGATVLKAGLYLVAMTWYRASGGTVEVSSAETNAADTAINYTTATTTTGVLPSSLTLSSAIGYGANNSFPWAFIIT